MNYTQNCSFLAFDCTRKTTDQHNLISECFDPNDSNNSLNDVH